MPALTMALERTPRGSMVWPVPASAFAGLPETLAVGNIDLRRKDEFHLTVLGHREAGALFGSPAGEALLERWRAVWRDLDARVEWLDELWLLRRPPDGARKEAHSIAVACRAPAIAAARHLLVAWTRIELPVALPHVTLFWQGDPRGISIPDARVFGGRLVERGSWSRFGLVRPNSGD